MSTRMDKSKIKNDIYYPVLFLASIFENSFGPTGFCKILSEIDKNGMQKISVTKKGEKIVENIKLGNDVVKLLKGAIKSQAHVCGDGTKSVAILIGHFLMKAMELIDMGVSLPKIYNGYKLGYKRLLNLASKLAFQYSNDKNILRNVIRSTMLGDGVGAYGNHEFLVDIVYEAIEKVRSDSDKFDIENVDVKTYRVSHISESRVIDGIVTEPAYDFRNLHPEIPKKVENAKIALLNCPIEVDLPRMKYVVKIGGKNELRSLYEYEEKRISEIIEKFKSLRVNAVLCGRRVNVDYYFAKEGILLARNIPLSDLKRIANATGGKIVNSIKDIREGDLGYARKIEWKKFLPNGEWRLFVEGCQNPKSVSILVMGSSVIEEDAVKSMVRSGASLLECGKFVGGGGSTEFKLAMYLKKYALSMRGRESIVIEKFSESLLGIPIVLAKNAGMKWMDVYPQLLKKHTEDDGWFGIDSVNRCIVDTAKEGIIEPYEIKKSILSIACETALSLLRIDDILLKR